MSASIQPSCDRAIAHASPADGQPAPHGSWILATTILASSLAFIDGSVVNVGLPAIGQSLSATGGALTWILNAYLLPLSALLLIGGAAGDRYGRRRLLVLGTLLFAAASLLCAAAPTLAILLTGRVLQGVGAALLMPNSLAILGATFSGEARGRAIGVWAAVGAAAGAGAPLLGGWLIDVVGWRTIFVLNLPIALLAIVLALRFVPDQRDDDGRALDLPGGIIATLALLSSTWALTEWSATRHLDVPISVALVAGVVCASAFVVVERRRGDRAMLPLRLFASRDFIGLTLLTLLLYGALGGLLVLIPFSLITSHHYSATAAGAALLPLPIIIAITSTTVGRLSGRIGSRLPLTIGPLIASAGCVLALRIVAAEPGDYWTTVFPALVVVSLGMAGAVAPLTTAVLASVDAQHSGVASGFNSAIARTGGLIATALLAGVLTSHDGDPTGPARVAMLAAAVCAAAAGVCAFLFVGAGSQPVAASSDGS